MRKGSTSICILLQFLLHITVFGQNSVTPHKGRPPILPDVLVFKVDHSMARNAPNTLNANNLPFDTKAVKPLKTNASHAARNTKSVLDGIYKVYLLPGEDVLSKCEELELFSNILYAEPIYQEQLFYVPSDPEADPADGEQSYLDVIKAYEAWSVTRGSSDVIIGVIDTGADMDHEDLAGNIYVNDAEVLNGIDDDGNGYIDDRLGYDFANLDNDPQADGNEHGTLVGGLAAAHTDNGVGIAGLGFESKLAPLKAFTSESNLSFGTYEAIVYAADNGYEVLNLSWGSVDSYSQFNQDIINYAVLENDVVIVAAAGNNNKDVEFYPASYDNVLSVAATDNADSKASFSTYSNKVDIAAPGSAIYSTSNSGYGSDYGTSYASPIVAGVAALVRAEFPELNARQVMERLRVSADDIYSINSSPLLAGKLGKGRLNAEEAVSNADLKAARISEFAAYGPMGEEIFYGDSIFVDLTVENFLDSIGDLTLHLTTYDDEIAFEEVSIGSLGSLQTKSVVRIRGKVSEDVTPGDIIEIRVGLEDEGYDDFQQFSIEIAPDYIDFEAGNVLLTLGGNGELGLVNSGTIGSGLELASTTIADQIGLIFSMSYDDVADNAPTTMSGSGKNLDFEVEESIRPLYNSVADLYTYNVFTDRDELGLKVEQSTMAWESLDSAMVIDYRIINTSNSDFSDLSAGMIWDWDLGLKTENRASWDGDRTAYTCDADSSLFAGIRVITGGTVRHSALDVGGFNGNAVDVIEVTDSIKHHYLAVLQEDEAGAVGSGNDVAQIIGTTLASLNANDAEKMTMLIAFATDLSSLEARLDSLEDLNDDFTNNPPLAATFYSCEGAFADVTLEEGANYNFYSDVLGTTLVGSGDSISVGPVTADSTIYAALADSTYEGAIRRVSILYVEQVADFEIDQEVVFLGSGNNIVSFTDNSFEAVEWDWTFGNGDATTIQHPKLVYSAAGEYTVELSVVTKDGCEGTISKTLEVVDRPETLGIERVEVCAGEDVMIEGKSNDGLRVYASATDTSYVYDGQSLMLEKVTQDTVLLISNVVNGYESEKETITIDVNDVSPSYSVIPALDSLEDDYLWFINTTNDQESLTWSIDGNLLSSQDTLVFAATAGSYDVELVTVNDIGCSGTLNNSVTIATSATPTYTSPDVICEGDDVVVSPGNGAYFGFYADSTLSEPLHRGATMNLDSLVAPVTLYIAGLDEGLAGEAIEVQLRPNDLSFSIIPEAEALYLDQSRNVAFGIDTTLYDMRWYIDGAFYDAGVAPILNFVLEGVYNIEVEGKDADGCLYSDGLFYEVWERTPLVLNVAPGEDLSLSVYPNPSSEYIHIMTDRVVSHLGVLDFQGKLIMEKRIANAAAGRRAHGLAIHDLREGPYLLYVVFSDGTSESRRFIKK